MRPLDQLQRARQQRKEKELRRRQLGPLSVDCGDQVLTFLEWCRLNSLSERSGRRILASDDGPEVTELSAKRIGITVRANRKWQQRRTRAKAGA